VQNQLRKHIRKLIHPLKSEDELLVVLKARLTKKEYKTLNAWAEDVESGEICHALGLTQEEYDKLSQKLIKKLNQEKLKQELCE